MRARPAHALILAAAALAAAAPAHAQRAVLRGQVVDVRTGDPVPHAAVYVNDNRTSVLADAEGRFEVKHLRPGTRAVWADAPGFSMDMTAVEIPGDSARVTLEVRSDPVRLATLMVSTSRFDRRARGYGGAVRVFGPRELSGMWYPNVRQLLESRARVQPTNCPSHATLSGGGGCIYNRGTHMTSRVVVDEMPWFGGVQDLAHLDLADVSRVEVFGGGRQIRVYTRHFMDWVSKKPYVPTPLGVGW